MRSHTLPTRYKASSMISVFYIVLNEEKFIQASLRSVLKRGSVNEVIIVEGADEKYPRADEYGLSVDDTHQKIVEVMEEFREISVIYHRHGWAESKTELRQECLDLSKGYGWGLFVDGDEVWSDGAWHGLTEAIENNPDAGAVYFKHLHFWKDFNTIATGSMWDAHLFRCFRFTSPDLKIDFHGGEPLDDGVPVSKKAGRVIRDNVKLHHYGAVKEKENIQAKLEYYRKRDTKLKVTDTWTGWSKGQPTQWTHGGGSAIEYTGSHPVEIVEEFGL